MRVVDLFAGCGGFTLGAEMAGANVVWAANHWPLAVRTHSTNHPNVQHECQDLMQKNWLELPEYDLLTASPACVPADAQIEMSDGSSKRADEIRLGDMVLTHAGRGRRVVNIWPKSYSGSMYSLRMYGDTKQSVDMTGDHLVMVRRRGGHLSKLGESKFMRADQVRPGDYVAFPRIKECQGTADAFLASFTPKKLSYEMPSHSVVGHVRMGRSRSAFVRGGGTREAKGAKVFIGKSTKDLWWLIGHYLGDGQSRDDRPQLGWSVGGNSGNASRVMRILGDLGLSCWERGPATNRTIFTSSKHLHAICSAFGRLSYEKFIPSRINAIETEYAESLIAGYLAADGYVRTKRANHVESATSTSLSLLQGIQRLCWRIGWSASISVADYARKTLIEGRLVNCKDTWTISITPKPTKFSRVKFDLDADLVWRSVADVDAVQVDNLTVLDFEVEEDHTFCLPGVVVHNCQGHSSASQPRRNEKHETMRTTAWAVVECVEQTRPKAFLVENVEQFASWQLFDLWFAALERLGYHVTAQVLNASRCGVPQRRKRLIVAGSLAKKIEIREPGTEELAFNDCIDESATGWKSIVNAGSDSRGRMLSASALHGRCLVQHVTGHRGIPLHEPIRTITTKAQWCLVDGERYRWLTPRELARGMSFPDTYWFPEDATIADQKRLIGNAIPPLMAKAAVEQILQ